ncbi:MAG: siphovirus Gp157 family protein [Anaeroplasmataceae bacterium]
MNFKELWEVKNDIVQLDSIFAEEDIDEEMYQQIRQNMIDEVENGSSDLLVYSSTLSAKIEECKQHIKRLTEYKKHIERKEERLNNFLVDVMDTVGTTKLDTQIGEITMRKSKFVDIVSPEMIPDKYLKEKIEYSFDKKLIKADIADGIDVPGAIIAEKKNIGIK